MTLIGSQVMVPGSSLTTGGVFESSVVPGAIRNPSAFRRPGRVVRVVVELSVTWMVIS